MAMTNKFLIFSQNPFSQKLDLTFCRHFSILNLTTLPSTEQVLKKFYKSDFEIIGDFQKVMYFGNLARFAYFPVNNIAADCRSVVSMKFIHHSFNQTSILDIGSF